MEPLIIIAGPTAVGKSDISVKLAQRINGQIISADSMQVYKGMDIGSAKIMPDEMGNIKHHLIDVLDPVDDFNVVTFQRLAKDAITNIRAEGCIPIIVGGTGFYIQSVLYDIDFDNETKNITAETQFNKSNDANSEMNSIDITNITYRNILEDEASKYGADYLFEKLRVVDPKSCELIHKNNIKRVIRALEFYYETGKPISEHNSEQRKRSSAYNDAFFVLNDDRDYVYSRIDLRVDKMLEAGLIDEVKTLKDKGITRNYVSMQGLGYKEILDYLDGKITLEEAVYIIKRDSRHFAKRQITWFKREPDAIWVDKSIIGRDDDSVIEFMLNILKDKGIIQ